MNKYHKGGKRAKKAKKRQNSTLLMRKVESKKPKKMRGTSKLIKGHREKRNSGTVML